MGNKKNNNEQATAKPQTEKIENLIENAKYGYEQVNGWIENADNKVSVSCGIFTGVFGVITFLSERITGSTITNECWHCVYRVSFFLSLVLLGFSILSYVLAINPNLSSSGKKGKKGQITKKYPIFYGDIADIEQTTDYKTKITKATGKDLLDELLTETHFNSCICKRKMQRYQWGLWMSFISIGLAMLSWVGRFLMYR